MPQKKLPADFEKKVKQAPPANGAGYPYQLSAKDLMDNFKYLLDIIPEASTGDMLYYDGAKWVVLAAPSGGVMNVLSHNGTSPEWVETQDCSA